MTSQFRAALLILLAFAVATFCQAQKSPGAYSEAPFDPKVVKLKPGYKGHDIERLAAALAKLKTLKGEFESSADYDHRIARISSAPLYGGLTANSTFACAIPTYITYDADKEQFIVEIIPSFAFLLNGLSNPDDNSLNLMLKSFNVATKDLGYYKGQNAFGATAQIHKTETRSTNLYVMNPNDCGFSFAHSDQTYDVSCKAEEAKRAKDQIGVLAVFTTRAPYLGSSLDLKMPTIDEPSESMTNFTLVGAVISDFVIYNQKTGVVYTKLKA